MGEGTGMTDGILAIVILAYFYLLVVVVDFIMGGEND
jgi:hypothetical protein